jgi:divalent metal cation (Fe/Co/Zn/Cd) transporter
LNEHIRELTSQIPGVQAIDSVKAHRFGQYLVINLAIFVDGAISVDEGDAISDHVEKALVDGIDYVRAVHVHFHSKVGTQI